MLHTVPVSRFGFSGPEGIAAYRPKVTPPDTHPRLWVTQDSVGMVRANLARGENKAVWQRLRGTIRSVVPQPPSDATLSDRNGWEMDLLCGQIMAHAVNMAFVALMEEDDALGRRACDYVLDRFCNLAQTSNSRALGEMIYGASVVYDWCHHLLSSCEKKAIRDQFAALRPDLEIGWPPFKIPAVNGHGNEAMLNRDLLSMSIAIYEDEPEPYRLVAYRIFEEVIPMRVAEYESPRHSQGYAYGAYRYFWELQCAWLLRRMTGEEQFHPNIKKVAYAFLYGQLPNRTWIRFEDGFLTKEWGYAMVPFLAYTYGSDPVLKHEYRRHDVPASRPEHPVSFPQDSLFLLLNDPDLPEAASFDSLPLVRDSSPVVGAMNIRTGWNLTPDSRDVLVELRGGGYNFGGHAHSGMGTFQIHYRGLQAADLAQYVHYGTEYDVEFAKRTISKCGLLVLDPDEVFEVPGNDGGQWLCPSPKNINDLVVNNHVFLAGHTLHSDQHADFAFYSVDLAQAYSAKVRHFVRNFVWLNLHGGRNPGVLIVFDRVMSAEPQFRKTWQINSLAKPEITPDGVKSVEGQGAVHTAMLLPRKYGLTLSGGDSHCEYGGKSFAFPDAKGGTDNRSGWRAAFSPEAEQCDDTFLAAVRICDADAEPLPASLTNLERAYQIEVADRVVLLPQNGREFYRPFSFELKRSAPVLVAGIRNGDWRVNGVPRTVTAGTLALDGEAGAICVTLGTKP